MHVRADGSSQIIKRGQYPSGHRDCSRSHTECTETTVLPGQMGHRSDQWTTDPESSNQQRQFGLVMAWITRTRQIGNVDICGSYCPCSQGLVQYARAQMA